MKIYLYLLMYLICKVLEALHAALFIFITMFFRLSRNSINSFLNEGWCYKLFLYYSLSKQTSLCVYVCLFNSVLRFLWPYVSRLKDFNKDLLTCNLKEKSRLSIQLGFLFKGMAFKFCDLRLRYQRHKRVDTLIFLLFVPIYLFAW